MQPYVPQLNAAAYSNEAYWQRQSNPAYSMPYTVAYSPHLNSSQVLYNHEPVSSKTTTFSPNAPEFFSQKSVPKGSTSHQQSSASGISNEPSAEVSQKKKKKKKKKKIEISEGSSSAASAPVESLNQTEKPLITEEKMLKVTSILVRNPIEKTLASKPLKSVQFQAEESDSVSLDNDKKTVTPTNQPNYSNLFKKPESKKREEIIESAWPDLTPSNANRPTTPIKQADVSPQKVLSFAEKLKGRNGPVKSPYLDWRDQRTNVSHSAAKAKEILEKNYNEASSKEKEKQAVPAPQSSIDSEISSSNDGFIEIRRKKIKDVKKPETVPEVVMKPILAEKKDDATLLAIKAEREKKKLREKEKKKRIREEKILAEKLGPKNQKISFITPKIMEKFLANTSNVKSTQPIMKLDEDFFPPLQQSNSRGYLSGDSESEWETTEVKVVTQKQAPKTPAAAQPISRNVKRSSRIEYDLMALINKKTTKKAPVSKADRKARTGVVANVLDRSAPVLSRGKVRNKKRKLSEIRKALLVAKAKRKLQALPNTGGQTRPHQLHSKKFREYCDQVLTDEIDVLARDM